MVCNMSFFSQADFNAILAMSLEGHQSTQQERVFNRLLDLHQQLMSRIKLNQIDLYPNFEVPEQVATSTTVTPFEANVMTLAFSRSEATAEIVEGMMGRDGIETSDGLKVRHHPVIELRLTPENFVVELVVSSFAWYDQQNFAGKITVEQQRSHLNQILSDMQNEYFIGFWTGTQLSETRLTTRKLPPQHILLDYLTTFAAGRDWLRFGHWFQPEDDISVDAIFDCIQELYAIYSFITWTSNNNFQTFYNRADSRA